MPAPQAPTVGQVVTGARDKHPLFRKQATGDPLVWRFLTEYQQELLGRLADLQRDAVRESETIELPLADFDAGVLFLQAEEESVDVENPGYLLIHGGDVVFTDSNRPAEELQLLQFANRFDRHRFTWPAYIQGYRLHLVGAAVDWETVASIELHYFPAGATLRGPEQRFSLPGQPLNVLVAAAALFLAERADAELNPKQGRPVDLRMFLGRKAEAEQLYINRVTGRNRARVSTTREVW